MPFLVEESPTTQKALINGRRMNLARYYNTPQQVQTREPQLGN